MADTKTTQEFTWRSLLPSGDGNFTKFNLNPRTKKELDYGAHNFAGILQERAGKFNVAKTATPTLLSRVSNVNLTYTTLTGTSSNTFGFPHRTELIHMPSALSQKFMIIPTEILMVGWNGLETGTSTYSRELKFCAGKKTTTPPVENVKNTNQFNSWASDRVVRWVADSVNVVDQPAIARICPIDSHGSPADNDTNYLIGRAVASNTFLGSASSDQDEYFAIECFDNSSQPQYMGTVDCICVYGLIYQLTPHSTTVFTRRYRKSFSPIDVSSMDGHWTGNLLDKSKTDGDLILVLKDRSGNSGTDRDFATNSVAPPVNPTLRTANALYNGHPVIQFDGSNDFLDMNSGAVLNYDSTAESYTYFAVFDQPTTTSSVQNVIDKDDSSQFALYVQNGKVMARCGGLNVIGGQSGSPVVTGSVPVIASVHNSHQQDKALLYLNGTFDDVDTSTNGTSSGDQIYLGAKVNFRGSISGYFTGNIAEIIVFSKFVGEEERQKIEGYLAHKYGLLGNLPASHPYKTAVPTVEINELQEY
tara:strand:- start:352 stop:1944 length:1593 start_codon:yes stop_codon:yes gene_type:complete